MKRIALSLATLGMLAVFNAPAKASDLSVFLRSASHGSNPYGYHNQPRYRDQAAYRGYQRDLDYRQAYRAPTPYRGTAHSYVPHAPRVNYGYAQPRSAYRPGAYSPGHGAPYGKPYGSSYRPPYPRNYPAPPYGGASCARPGFSFSLGY